MARTNVLWNLLVQDALREYGPPIQTSKERPDYTPRMYIVNASSAGDPLILLHHQTL
ncbi:MAG TPA: hypothetical protein VFQ23_22065 [Anaerolineales bacterium]|nr:hypothetical protein [Anaerolineales bacterium]